MYSSKKVRCVSVPEAPACIYIETLDSNLRKRSPTRAFHGCSPLVVLYFPTKIRRRRAPRPDTGFPTVRAVLLTRREAPNCSLTPRTFSSEGGSKNAADTTQSCAIRALRVVIIQINLVRSTY